MWGKFFTRREYVLTVLAVALVICQVYMDIAIPDYMSRITDAYLLEDLNTVVKYGIDMVLCACGSLIMSVLVGFVVSRIAAAVGRNMREAQFERVQKFSTEDIGRFSAASLITRSTNDVTQIQNFVARGLQIVIKAPIMAVWATSKIYSTSLEWTGFTVMCLILLVVVMLVSLYFAVPRFKRIQWLTDVVNRSTRENLDGMRVIRAYNAADYQGAKFERANTDLLNNNISATKFMAPVFPFAHSMMNFITLGIYWIGAGLIVAANTTVEQKLLFSDMIVFSSYATMVLTAVMMFFGIFRMLPRAMVGYRRIKEVVNTEPTITDGGNTDGTEKGTIEFRDVTFAYPGSDRNTLEGVSFKVESGKTVAVIGPTGSGKSTVVNLISRLYDVSGGGVFVDGRDVREYDTESLRIRIGYVPQSAVIFSGSVRMNVNYGHGSEGRTDEDVWRALRIAQAEDFVRELPEGLDAHISQHGRNLSGGQKQRISIARAVCRSPEIYLLDDTFSALDYRTDRELRRSLREEMRGSTVFIVAQRIGTIRDADEIIVLDEGKVVGRGTHSELLSNCPLYADIARSQLTQEELL